MLQLPKTLVKFKKIKLCSLKENNKKVLNKPEKNVKKFDTTYGPRQVHSIGVCG